MPGKECWLFIRKDADGKIRYALSNAPEDIPLEEMIKISARRWTIKQLFKEGKSCLGMDSYEIRSYSGWHRHMALVFLVMHFLTYVRIEFGKKNILTLSQAKRLLIASLAEGRLSLKKAIEIACYHVKRNEAARLSCRRKKIKMLQRAG